MLPNLERLRADRARVRFVIFLGFVFKGLFLLFVDPFRRTLNLTKVDRSRCNRVLLRLLNRMSMVGVFLFDFFVVLLFQLDAVLASVEECQRVPQKLIVGYAPFPESHVLVQLVGAQFAHEHWQVALVNYLYRRAVVNLLGEQNVRK
uniref:(northern house mosquito) hypothetical protein n=1 Tax=Culex pipiens TaxID=7175 RepID=A0A8D8C0Y0_CULPI